MASPTMTPEQEVALIEKMALEHPEEFKQLQYQAIFYRTLVYVYYYDTFDVDELSVHIYEDMSDIVSMEQIHANVDSVIADIIECMTENGQLTDEAITIAIEHNLHFKMGKVKKHQLH